MKAIVVSDTHIGDYPYGKTDPETGLNTRLLDFLDNFDQTIEFAITKKANVFIIVGDIYRVKHPSSKIRKQFAAKLAKIIQANIKVILMTGNHDMTTSSDGAHAMSEMEELSPLIDQLTVVSSPSVIDIDNTRLYCLPFVNRGEQELLTPEDFLKFQKQKIQEFNDIDDSEEVYYSLFFGHFGTDKSEVGNSFDLDMSSNEFENMIQLSDFGKKWTKIYLGHIHKHQEFNNVARHVGSIGKVDFSEEDEQKGFYFYEDGHDEFIPIKDREFKTFQLNLKDEQCKEQLNKFYKDIQKIDLSNSIVRIKVNVIQTYYPLVKFDKIESYLRTNCWHFTSVDINVIAKEDINENIEKITSTDLPTEALKKYVEKHPDRYKGIEEKVITKGHEILTIVKNNSKG